MGRNKKKSKTVIAQQSVRPYNHADEPAARWPNKRYNLRRRPLPRKTECSEQTAQHDYGPGPSDPQLRKLWEITKRGDIDWVEATSIEAWERLQALYRLKSQAEAATKPLAVHPDEPQAAHALTSPSLHHASMPPESTSSGDSSPRQSGEHARDFLLEQETMATPHQSTYDLLAPTCELHPFLKSMATRLHGTYNGALFKEAGSSATAGNGSVNESVGTQTKPSLLGSLARSIGMDWSDDEEGK